MDDFKKYEQMKSQAVLPRQAYRQAKMDGLDEIATIRMLRRVYGLNLAQAKEATGAADALASKQEVKPGATVYWEDWSDVEGFYLMQAQVERIVGDMAELSHARKFQLTNDGLVETPADLSPPMKLSWLERSLTERIENLLKFTKSLSELAPIGS
jgi:hypothetical protein